jgi:hypothetical protein
MTTMLRKILAFLAASLAISLPASASSYSIDYTDLWLTNGESGWGLNLIQQSDTMFATLFVYGTDNTPRWFSASAIRPASAGNQTQFTGSLSQTTGPYFGGPFNQATVVNTPVGSMTLTFANSNAGTLTYVVNGVTVNKAISRFAYAANNLAGDYLGGLTAQGTNCNSGIPNGPILIFGQARTDHSQAQAVKITVNFNNGAGTPSQCIYNGTYSQAGRQGAVTGTWGCTFNGANPTSGPFSIQNIEPSLTGWTGRFNGSDQFCTYNGNFGFVRDVL